MNSKRQKTMFAGPFCGEFGWELFCWQGFLRKIATKYDRVVIACRTGHDLLYEDFADEIVHYDPVQEKTDMWRNHGEINVHNFHQQRVSLQDTVIRNDTFKSRWWLSEHWSKRQLLLPMGQLSKSFPGYDILLIVRDTGKCNTNFRNWEKENARRFIVKMRTLGYTIACIGMPNSADCIGKPLDVVDERGVTLKRLAQIMSYSKVIVGPQSGPIHFATLCGLPQVTWQTCKEHAVRTMEHWNPFKTPVTTIPGEDRYWKKRMMWQPDVETLVKHTLTLLKGKQNG